eukprot:763485-Hanusia_phi.AAC.3
MSAQGVATVLGPSLLHPKRQAEDTASVQMLSDSIAANRVTLVLIENFEFFRSYLSTTTMDSNQAELESYEEFKERVCRQLNLEGRDKSKPLSVKDPGQSLSGDIHDLRGCIPLKFALRWENLASVQTRACEYEDAIMSYEKAIQLHAKQGTSNAQNYIKAGRDQFSFTCVTCWHSDGVDLREPWQRKSTENVDLCPED